MISSIDRSGTSRVGSLMRRLRSWTGIVSLAAVAACGGGSKQVKAPPAGVTYEKPPAEPDQPVIPDQPPPKQPDPVATNDTPPEPEKPPPEPPAPERPKPPPPKPPGEDLTPEQKRDLVDKNLAAARDATRREDSDTMIADALTVLDADQANAEAMITLAHGYFLKKWDDKAEGVLDEAKNRVPELAVTDRQPAPELRKLAAKRWMILALIYDRSTRDKHEIVALEDYSRAIKDDPDYAKAYTNRGTIYLARKAYLAKDGNGEPFGALLDFEKVNGLELKHEMSDNDRASCGCVSANTCTGLGAAYRGHSTDSGQPRDELLQRAERCFKNAMTRDANYAEAYYDMGLLYLDGDPFPGMDKLKRLSQARVYLQQYKTKVGPNIKQKESDLLDSYIATAQKQYDVEQKIQDNKKKIKEQQEKQKAQEEKDKAKDAGKDAGGGGK